MGFRNLGKGTFTYMFQRILFTFGKALTKCRWANPLFQFKRFKKTTFIISTFCKALHTKLGDKINSFLGLSKLEL